MKSNRLHIAVLVALANALAALGARADELSQAELDAAVAGSESAATQTDGAHATVVVADDSFVELQLRRSIVLSEYAQANAATLNVANAANADVAHALNVLHGGIGVQGMQSNLIGQQEVHYGRAETIARQGVNRHSMTAYQGGYDTRMDSTRNTQSILASRSYSSVVDTYNAQVPAYNPLQNLSLTLGTPKLPSVTVPAFGFDLTTTDDVGGIYGIRGGLGPFYFDPPQIVLGTVSLSGNDVLIKGGFVQLPSLDLGKANIDLCVVKCGGVSVDLPTINGPRIDFGNEYRIANANPFKDVRINAGGGMAVAGRGHIQVNLGHVTVGASLSLDIPDLTTSFSFDVLGYTVDTGKFGVTIPPISASINLIDSDVGVAYTADFDGALCVSIVTTPCDGLSHREVNEDSHVEIVKTTQSATQSSSSALTTSSAERLVIGATMTGAEADLIAMSEGHAAINTESVIQLDAQAQRGLRAMSAVNATGTLVGNAVNVGVQPNVSNASLSQSNVFTQYQTRPRGP